MIVPNNKIIPIQKHIINNIIIKKISAKIWNNIESCKANVNFSHGPALVYLTDLLVAIPPIILLW